MFDLLLVEPSAACFVQERTSFAHLLPDFLYKLIEALPGCMALLCNQAACRCLVCRILASWLKILGKHRTGKHGICSVPDTVANVVTL